MSDHLTGIAVTSDLVINQAWHDLVAAEARAEEEAILDRIYDRGRRDMLNAILSVNPEVARRYHDIVADEGAPFTNEHGKIPFDVLIWVTAVAEHLGIQPKEAPDA